MALSAFNHATMSVREHVVFAASLGPRRRRQRHAR